jgi:uncharacterized membrane protein YkvA (DUF1232 family)
MGEKKGWNKIKDWAQRMKRETWVLYFACRHPQTPWYARLLAVLVVGYALSPIDLIPDFIPIVGYLDDLILVPLGLSLAMRMIPAEVINQCRQQAELETPFHSLAGRVAAGVIILIWVAAAIWIGSRILVVWQSAYPVTSPFPY